MATERDRLLDVARALAELEARQASCPIAAFKPHLKQNEFIHSSAPIVIFLAGNRAGKTHSLVCEIIASGLGYRPWLVPNFQLIDGQFPPRHQIPSAAWVRRADGLPINVPSRILVITGLSLARGIGEIIQEKFMALWPNEIKFKALLGPLGAWQKVILPNGSEITFGAASQTNMAFEGFAADAVFADEPLPRRIFTAVRRGLVDRRGQIKWSLTPLGGADTVWMAADLLTNERADVHVIRCASFENPHISREALEAFFADPAMSDEERRARQTGEIAALGRIIVSTFGEHAIMPSTTIEHTVPRMLVIDPHHARLPVMLWLALFNEGRDIVAYREWPTHDLTKASIPRITIPEVAAKIKELEGKESVLYRVCDPAFGPQHAKVLGQSFPSFVEEMAQYQLFFDARVDNDIERGIQELRDAFAVDPILKRPRVQIMRHLSNTIRSLHFWSYLETSSGELKPAELYKDQCDVLRYALMFIRSGLPITKDAWSYNQED